MGVLTVQMAANKMARREGVRSVTARVLLASDR